MIPRWLRLLVVISHDDAILTGQSRVRCAIYAVCHWRECSAQYLDFV